MKGLKKDRPVGRMISGRKSIPFRFLETETEFFVPLLVYLSSEAFCRGLPPRRVKMSMSTSEAPDDRDNILPIPSPSSSEQAAWRLFSDVLKIVFQSWTSLSLAVQNNWGGGDSKVKASAFVDSVIEIFRQNQSTCAKDLEDHLEIVMEESFSCELEDSSQTEVILLLVNRSQF
jgi:hypothetical protein